VAASLLDRRKGKSAKSGKPAKGSVAATLPQGLLDKLKARIDIDPTLARDQTPVTAPATGETLGTTPMATESDVAAAVSRARQAQVEWAQTSIKDRAKILLRFHDLVLSRRSEGVALIRAENGKSRRDAYEEILDTAGVARYYARTAAKHLASHAVLGVLPGLTMAREQRRPLGVVGLIVPWNYPLVLGVTDAIPALMAGNACVTKADRETPYSALWAATLLDEAGLPEGLFQVITGSGAELGGPLIDRVDYMMFTGSTATGKKVAEQCGSRLISYSMELGGKNALLVLDDADIDRTVEGAVRAAFSNAGQLCIHAERIFILEGVYDAFATKFAARVNGMKVSTGDDTDMGSLISKKQLDTVVEHVADAVAKGATVLAGGKALPDVGPYFHQPTLLEGVEPGMTVFAE
jgi:succinate-semialdehyde dehydrogenase/glutarate-semialdehyde dehydrogenase